MTAPVIAPHIFRAYDIRGVVGVGLDPDVMRELGRAIASEALDLGERCLVLGADARLSSPALAEAMREGILSTGCDLIDIGVVPTPLMYFATHIMEAGSGVMITASHNPAEYNGVKIVLQRHCLADRQIHALHERLLRQQLHSGQGRYETRRVEDAYLARVTGDLHLGRRFKVVIDCGNGVTGGLAPRLFEALGCEVLPLFCELDGRFPNHHPDPTVETNLAALRAEVARSGADLGIAFDGDGDRLGVVSGSGALIDADVLLLAFVRDILPAHPGARVVFDVKCTSRLRQAVEAAGGVPVLCRSGHSFVKRAMQDCNALLGGEYSAHLFFRHRWYGFDDGLYVAARFLELLARRGEDADTLLAGLPRGVNTPELHLPVPESDKFALMERLLPGLHFPEAEHCTLDGLRAEFPRGWGLIRASNTTPSLVLRFEADDATELARIKNLFRERLTALAPELPLPF